MTERLERTTEAETAEVRAICDQIMPLLRGQRSGLVGATLMWLTARWVSGHVVPGDPEETARLQGRLMGPFIEAVVAMAAANHAEMQERAARGEGIEMP